MLNPGKDRQDYGQLLSPPEGYELDFAVGTTYSLDLDALVGATLSLGLSEEADTELLNNPICLLEAFRATGDKVALFCEAGQIHLPRQVTSLYMLLEKMVLPVTTNKNPEEKGYPSFHPKMWLIKYKNNDETLYRVMVMSRNLTFDRSWDVVFSMDGVKTKARSNKNKPLADFIAYLRDELPETLMGEAKRASLHEIIKDLPYVKFDTGMKEFKDFEFVPHGVKRTKTKKYTVLDSELFTDTYHEMLVISPFLSKDIVRILNESHGTHIENPRYTLITRKMSLGRISKDAADTFNIYVLKDKLIDGESAVFDDQVATQTQDIHAKLFLTRKDSSVNLYLGSLNATHNAVYRNVEFMIKLRNTKGIINTDELLEDICNGPIDEKESPFIEVSLNQYTEEAEGDDKKSLDTVVKELNRCKPTARVVEKDDLYDIEVGFSHDVESLKTHEITIRPLLSNKRSGLEQNMVFPNLQATQLSEFFVVYVDGQIERLLMIPTENMPEDREKQIVSSVVKDKDNFYAYINYLLGDDLLISNLEYGEYDKAREYSGNYRNMMAPALYEKMLKTAAHSPEKLKGIEYLLNMISEDGVIPEEFIKLYSTVKKVVGIRD